MCVCGLFGQKTCAYLDSGNRVAFRCRAAVPSHPESAAALQNLPTHDSCRNHAGHTEHHFSGERRLVCKLSKEKRTC